MIGWGCLFICGVVVLLWSIWRITWMPGGSGPESVPESAVATLVESLREDLRVLAVEIGERHVPECHNALRRAADFLDRQLTVVGYLVRRDSFVVEGHTVCNLDVERTGVMYPEEIIIVGAHYDTVSGSPGANDNGSAVVATLALARALARVEMARTVRLAFFVNEESPYYMTESMGSLRYAQGCRMRQEDVRGMMSLETIGYYVDRSHSQRYPVGILRWFYPTRGNFVAFVGNVHSRHWVHETIRGFRRTSFPSQGIAAPRWLRDIFRSDHASFWQYGFPALMVTDTANFRYPYYHTAEDTPDKIDFESLARVVLGLKASLEVTAGSLESAPPRRPKGHRCDETVV